MALNKTVLAAGLLTIGLTVATDAQETSQMVPYEQIEFAPQAPGSELQVAVLWGDRDKGEYGMLLKFPPGYVGDLHSHTHDYHAVNLKGVWVHTIGQEKAELPADSYVRQGGGEVHSDACKGPEECVILVHQKGHGDFIPAH